MVIRQNEIEVNPIFDEGWWASLLSEEERYCAEPPSRSAGAPQEIKTGMPKPRPLTVDWEHAQHLYENDETAFLRVTGFNRGGLLVEGEGLHGFVPLSHLIDFETGISDTERDRLLADYVGRTMCLKVIECDASRGRIVFSQRAALAGDGCRNLLFDSLQPGEHVRGEVTNVTDFGVFVDLGGVEGLIHVSELSWGRVHHPSDVAGVGDRLEALVLNIDRDRARVALSLKRLHPNPWETAETRYYAGQVLEATITSIVQFGAFARLEEGLDGLIHISEIGAVDRTALSEVLHEGQRVQVRVLHVDAARQRLGLSWHKEDI